MFRGYKVQGLGLLSLGSLGFRGAKVKGFRGFRV